MSLMSLITTGSSQTSSSSSASASTAAAIKAAIAASTASTTTTTSSGSGSGNGVTISAAAKIAAAEVTDNAKDFATLTGDVRKTLDAQYAADKTAGKTSSTPDIGEFSGRALAAVALNRDGDFSSKEVAAAKAELRTRTREQFSSLVGNSMSLGGMAAYNQQLVSQYDSMSSEEREALGWTDKIRSSAASFVGTSSQPSLFDQLGDIDNWS
jgi:hypothetical protein